jgi:iron complex transport system permease protein
MTTTHAFGTLRWGPLGRYTLPLLGLAALVVLAFAVGRFPVSVGDLFAATVGKWFGTSRPVPATVETVIYQVRGPRVLAALVVGAALATAGAAYQGMFRNPLVSPDILGVSSGAALGAALAIFLSWDLVGIQALAFVGGLAAVGMAYGIAVSLRGRDPLLTLILAGVVIGTLLGSCVSLLKYLADPYNQLPAITFWLLGSLASVSPADLEVVVPTVLIGLAPLMLLRWRMNLLTLPDDEARALGVETTRLRLAVVCAATLVTAASVAISGIIGWIGLLVPHAARMLVGPGFARMLPMTIILGAGFMLAVDTLARTTATLEVPPGVLTALLGTPMFLWLLAKAKRAW